MHSSRIPIVFAVPILLSILCLPAQAQDVNQLYAQANKAKQSKNYDEAIGLYRKVLELSPDFAVGYYDLACAQALKGDRKSAVESLKMAVDKGYVYFERMKDDPDLKKLKNDNDFKAILKEKDKYVRAAADKKLEYWKGKLGDPFKYARDDKYKFIVAYEVSAAQMQNIIRNLQLTADSHAKHLFTKKPDYYLSVVICAGGQAFTRLLGAGYSRAAGAYVHAHKTLYVRIDTGIGTVTHEFTHALHWADALARKQDAQPQWVVEGFGTLYESPTFTKSGEIKSHLSWQHHWRLPGLQQSIQNGTYKGFKNVFYNWSAVNIAHAYQIVKYLFLYLQEEGLLYKFYKEYTKTYPDDPNATNTTAAAVKALEKVVGKKIDDFEPEWKNWVSSVNKPMMGVYFDENYNGKGAKVREVVAGSPAQKGGIQAGDIILAMDGKQVDDHKANLELLKKKKRGDKAVFKVKRAGEEIELTLELGVYPRK